MFWWVRAHELDESMELYQCDPIDSEKHCQLMLSHYQEAACCLEMVSQECKKTEDVDIDGMLTNISHCIHCLNELADVETNEIRLDALEQLLVTLDHQQKVLSAKKAELEYSVTFGGHCESKDRGYEKHAYDQSAQSRLLTIENTLINPSGIKFSEVAGLKDAKQALREAIILPVMYPHLFTGARKPWKRILLYGPPGTGKTRLAQAVAGEIKCHFYSITSSDLMSSWVGETEKIIRDLFAHSKQQEGTSVIFIDEVDSVCRCRSAKEEEHTRRIKTELLKQMEGAADNTFLVCTTNCPWELDPAFLRRFQKRIFLPLPCREARLEILKLHVTQDAELNEQDWGTLVENTEGFSGSDIATCTADAVLEPVRELETCKYWKHTNDRRNQKWIPCDKDHPDAVCKSLTDLPSDKVHPRDVNIQDFMQAFQQNHRTVSKDQLAKYEWFTSQLGQTG
ncbi:uncharacterized protein [Dysidea avara]|uniref:uncharacterized protein n=1 Tax=Dysidea avara TaxID=196820 RepID=UPI0033253290